MLSADTRQLKALATALRRSQPALYRETQKGLRAVGATVAARAKSKADWSSRIPATVKVSAAGVNAVKVSAGGQAAPHAAAYEHAGAPGHFRHPVFAPKGSHGDRSVPWVDETARPFLHPAAIELLDESAKALAEALTVQVEQTIHGQQIAI